MCQTLWFFAGPNGGGKTTLANRIIDKSDIDFLNSDNISAEIGDQSQIRTGRILMKRFYDIIGSQKSFAMESTISGRGHLSLMDTVHRAGYKIIMIYTFVDNVEQNLARVRQRKDSGGHDVPESVVKSRYVRSIRNFRETAKRSDVWQLYYNGTGAYDKVALGVNTSELVQDQSKYDMFCGIEEQVMDALKIVPSVQIPVTSEIIKQVSSLCR